MMVCDGLYLINFKWSFSRDSFVFTYTYALLINVIVVQAYHFVVKESLFKQSLSYNFTLKHFDISRFFELCKVYRRTEEILPGWTLLSAKWILRKWNGNLSICSIDKNVHMLCNHLYNYCVFHYLGIFKPTQLVGDNTVNQSSKGYNFM